MFPSQGMFLTSTLPLHIPGVSDAGFDRCTGRTNFGSLEALPAAVRWDRILPGTLLPSNMQRSNARSELMLRAAVEVLEAKLGHVNDTIGEIRSVLRANGQ